MTNAKRDKKRALIFLKLRRAKAQIAAVKKSVCLRRQKEIFQGWKRVEKQALDYAHARDKEMSTVLKGIYTKHLVYRRSLERGYASFSWRTKQLRALQEAASEKAAAYSQALEETSRARVEHIHAESRSDQAVCLYKRTLLRHLRELLYAESEENEEVASNRYILKSLRANFYE
ncbi:MAG: hypothetical protein JMM76_00585 [Candidatus Xiphinematobacter sp.]|nr:MAG: hypothetical protein JMM79_00610 [Candidatus Xiphinematobacter sp.]QQY09211.1 MAG: hypothetical protein JMM76_00585 [Candidatus Xiphinematobacter sp.]QQY09963.1 MAG: hypothetical protein JMM78_00595 [Candidatus Xiphinematobacter sp.]QQY10695.1 MAG: hypothetical protein JMM74_00575 [Candidatus Xiphinematobacter sp.]QQY11440.1 MAG: hypothetical protein JMM77_00605 [Candidatus Xiphinematobacter sp.]